MEDISSEDNNQYVAFEPFFYYKIVLSVTSSFNAL